MKLLILQNVQGIGLSLKNNIREVPLELLKELVSLAITPEDLVQMDYFIQSGLVVFLIIILLV
nr:MAG TPA: hypothetical protein [Bacteriophage sp.]